MSDRIQAVVILCLTLIQVSMLAIFAKTPTPELAQQLIIIPTGIIGYLAGKVSKGESK